MNSNIIAFAIQAHDSTNCSYDSKPYATHLALTVHFAYEFRDVIPKQLFQDVVNACWLHDTIEDCRITYNDIKSIAGERVAELVYAVTNEKGKSRQERANENYYLGIRNTAWATFVKLCDRLANVQYSKDTNSRMLDVYKKEHFHFKNSLSAATFYKPMFDTLESLLNLD